MMPAIPLVVVVVVERLGVVVVVVERLGVVVVVVERLCVEAVPCVIIDGSAGVRVEPGWLLDTIVVIGAYE